MTQAKENINMEIKHLVVPFELKAEDVNNDMGLFEGYGSVFGNIDFGGDIIEGGAFTKSLLDWQAKNQLPQMLGFHRDGNLIGDWLEMVEDSKGLYVKGQLWVKADKRIEQAQVSYNMMRGTGPKGLSIGYSVVDSELVEFNGGTVRRLKEIKLYEVSVVGYAMNEEADVTAVKSLTNAEGHLLSIRDVEKKLRDADIFTRTQVKALLSGGYDSLVRDEQEKIEAEKRDAAPDYSTILKSLEILSTTLKG